ncbi:unnamed protein product [Litomosoides sigmodontis]|uniref:BPTI-like C-terminal domain-containing protein n=1 Tax=Litomosoides sigmodontis TaxID=42156 RepID=A0A3P6U6K6_LITSI|nr:unnamed protein product [Litomosoides sigmodontis]
MCEVKLKCKCKLPQLCACPIGSPARGCDPMPFILWHDLIVNGCPNVTINSRDPAQKVHRWFRRVTFFPYSYCALIGES